MIILEWGSDGKGKKKEKKGKKKKKGEEKTPKKNEKTRLLVKEEVTPHHFLLMTCGALVE